MSLLTTIVVFGVGTAFKFDDFVLFMALWSARGDFEGVTGVVLTVVIKDAVAN
jgi:hypothetical protein